MATRKRSRTPRGKSVPPPPPPTAYTEPMPPAPQSFAPAARSFSPLKIFIVLILLFGIGELVFWKRGAASRWEEKNLVLQAEYGGPEPDKGALLQPVGVAVDEAGAVYVADAGKSGDPSTVRIVKYEADGKWDSGFHLADDQGVPINQLVGVTIDPQGNLTALDGDAHGPRFIRFRRDGKVTAVQAVGMYGPYSITSDDEGGVWVGSLWGAGRYDPSGKDTFWAGKDAKPGSNGTEKGQVSGPSCAVKAPNGVLYVADRGNWRIEKFGKSGSFDTLWDVPKDKFNGVLRMLALDAKGRVYCSAENGGALWVFNDDLSPIAKCMRIGSESLQNPMGLTSTKAGALFVADTGLRKVFKFAPI